MQTIRALRQDRGWTQYELALRVGVQPQAVYLWESGRRVPHVPQLRKLGQIFGLCSDEIELEPSPDVRRAPHQAHADRSPGAQTLVPDPRDGPTGQPVVPKRRTVPLQ